MYTKILQVLLLPVNHVSTYFNEIQIGFPTSVVLHSNFCRIFSLFLLWVRSCFNSIQLNAEVVILYVLNSLDCALTGQVLN